MLTFLLKALLDSASFYTPYTSVLQSLQKATQVKEFINNTNTRDPKANTKWFNYKFKMLIAIDQRFPNFFFTSPFENLILAAP